MRRKMRRNEKNAQNWYLSFNFTNVSDYATIKHRTFGRAQDLRAICILQEKHLCITRKVFVYHKKSICVSQKKAFVLVNNESWKIHGEKLIYI